MSNSYNTEIQGNNDNLRSILKTVSSLPTVDTTGGYRKTLLWTNSSPTTSWPVSDTSVTNILVDYSESETGEEVFDYDAYEIIFTNCDGLAYSSGELPVNNYKVTTNLFAPYDKLCKLCFRKVVLDLDESTKLSITYYPGYYQKTYGSDPTIDAASCVPWKIYGIYYS